MDQTLLLNGVLGQVFVMIRQLLFADKVPIGQKDNLQHADRLPFEFEVRIPPRSQFGACHVALGNVDAPGETDLPIHNQNFAVVAVVDLAGQPRKDNAHETFHLDTGLLQVADKSTAQSPTAYIVVDQTDFDSLLCLLNQYVGNLAAQWIIFNDVVLEMDRRFGGSQGRPNFVKCNGAVV